MRRFVAFLLFALPSFTHAQTPTPADLTTLTGKTYKAARVMSVEPDGINYMFAGGMAKIPFTELPEAIRKQYGYDPAKSAAFAAADESAQAAAYAAGQRDKRSYVQKQVEEFKPRDEVASNAAGATAPGGGLKTGALDAPATGPNATICGQVLQKVPEGLLVSCASDSYERHQIKNAPRGKVYGASYATGVVLLVGCPNEKNMADEDDIANIVAQDIGTLEYAAVSGARKTVHSYRYITGQ